MNENYMQWHEDEFLAFCLIQAASADDVIQDEEKALISQIIPEDRFGHLIEFNKKNTGLTNMKIIQELADKFSLSREDKLEIHAKIKRIFFSDGEYNEYEKNMNKIFDKLF